MSILKKHFLVYLTLSLALAFSSALKVNGQGLTISRLADDFYVYTTYKNLGGNWFPSNSMYLVTNAGVVLFDTPWDTTQFKPLLDSISARHKQQVVLCLSTHYHDDRTAGLTFLKSRGVKTYTSKQTRDLCRQHKEPEAEFYFLNDTVFTVGNRQFETYYPGKGHTADNLVVWFEKERILYGGCLVKSTENQGLGNIADAHLDNWARSIRKVIKKYPDPDFVIPGHFGWENNTGLKHTLHLLQQHNSK